ncbi:MAG TPA: response regulator [Pyrinomonadaceae bacterium]
MNSARGASAQSRQRRALIVASAGGLSLQQQLTAHGYVTRTVTNAEALSAITDFAPDVVMMVVAHEPNAAENETVALARKLRSETATYSLPVVFVWNFDEHSLRAAAQYIGADDYFSLATPAAEILARLDSLFWRAEADRRSAMVLSDRRLEIDNFMFMLDAVREDVRAKVSGTLALVYAIAPRGKEASFDKLARDRTLSEAHNFLKLNLRRVDAVAFYGPTMLLVYLPRMEARAAVAALSRLHREFLEEHPRHDFIAGLASFPAHTSDVEGLIEKAEESVREARSGKSLKQIVAYEPKAKPPVPAVPAGTGPGLSSPKDTKVPEGPATPVPTISESAAREAKAEIVTAPYATATADVAAESAEGRASAVARPTAEDLNARATEAASRELERRAEGAVMPRRLLLTISDAGRMTQINSLIRSAGYEARAAFDGQQALHLLRIERPDLLLLDYDLQGIDGVETIRRLRKQGGGQLSLPVVMLLSSNNERAEREALELGARSVLVAPYDPAELLENLRTAGSHE